MLLSRLSRFLSHLKRNCNQRLWSSDQVFIDLTQIKASANKRKFEKKIARKEIRAYEAKRQEELNQERWTMEN